MNNLGNSFGVPIGDTITVSDLIGNLITAAIVLAGVIMLFLFIGGGLTMIASAGSGDSQGAAKGKQAITWALIGFAVVFTAYWIIRIIEIWSGTNFITEPFFFA